jgi:hypothetical protein
MTSKYEFPKYPFALVSGKIIAERQKVGVMERDEPNPDLPFCGWAFFVGDESPEYLDKEENFWLHSVSKVLEVDPEVEQFLDAPVGSRFERGADDQWIEITE